MFSSGPRSAAHNPGHLHDQALISGKCFRQLRLPIAALPTLGAECLISGGKPTVFQRALKVAS